jgi:hypothetical protein
MLQLPPTPLEFPTGHKVRSRITEKEYKPDSAFQQDVIPRWCPPHTVVGSFVYDHDPGSYTSRILDTGRACTTGQVLGTRHMKRNKLQAFRR